MSYLAPHILEGLAAVALEPVPVKRLRHDPKLDDEVAREVFAFDFAPLFAPEADQRGLVLPHDGPGIGPTD